MKLLIKTGHKAVDTLDDFTKDWGAMQVIDPAELVSVVRRDQRSPDFEVLDWNMSLLSDRGATNAGLYRYFGQGRDQTGARSWSVVLKVVRESEQVTAQNDRFYWKREVHAHQSGLLSNLPHGIHVPCGYGTIQGDHHAASSREEIRIWMEHIRESRPERWALEQYAFAAHQLGCFHGAYLTGTPLPDYPWLCRNALVSWLKMYNPERGWDNAFVNRHISAATRDRIMRIWTSRDGLLTILDHLPQTFSHLDFKRDNLMIREAVGGQMELVVLDWERCGVASLGADLACLIGTSCLFFNWEPANAQRLEDAAMKPYLAGLRETGWQGEEYLARLGYTAWIGLLFGVIMSSAIAAMTTDGAREASMRLLGRAGDELASGWAMLGEFALSRVEEAQSLINQYGLP